VALGLLDLHPWEFAQYTIREFEEKVAGAQRRYVHFADVVMQHALMTGQWSKRVTFRDLTGREHPLELDPRLVEARAAALANESEDDREKRERTAAILAEHEARMQGQDRG